MLHRFTLVSKNHKGKIKGKKPSKSYVLDLGNELLQCEFTNELRTNREDIQIVCNHIAVENQTYFLFRSGSIQSAVGHISERLSCTFACAVNVLFALGVADIIFRPENTVNAYACSRAYCPILRHANEYC